MDLLPLISVGIAVVAVVISLRSSMLARKALTMSEADFRERHRPLSLYMIEGSRISKRDTEHAAFAMTVTNGAVSPETIVRIELRVFFKDITNNLQFAALPLEVSLTKPLGSAIATSLNAPLNLAARATQQGWISFEIPEPLHREKIIEKYQICFATSNAEATYDSYVLRSIQLK
jgi:hypothetical protein